MYCHQRLASVQYRSAQLKHVQDMTDMKGQVERTKQLLTKAGNEKILLAEELHLKFEQLKVMANTYEGEWTQTLQRNHCLQKQLNLTKTKYDVDKSTNRSAQFDNMQAVLLNVTQGNNVLLQIMPSKTIS